MRLDPNESLGGTPILEVRDFLRRWRSSAFRIDDLQARFGDQATDILEALKQRAIVDHAPVWRDEVRYAMTAQGGTFLNALAVPPVRRETAERALQEFLVRCREVNSDNHFAYKVERATVFGSFLSSADRVGDVDIALRICPKVKFGDPDRWMAKVGQQVRAAKRGGRRFSSYFEELAFGVTSVQQRLKNRSRVLQFTDESDGALKMGPTRVVFEDLTT
jgi:hypothetical protein